MSLKVVWIVEGPAQFESRAKFMCRNIEAFKNLGIELGNQITAKAKLTPDAGRPTPAF